jgi:hypothetical protein
LGSTDCCSGASHAIKGDSMAWGQADGVAEEGLMTPVDSADLGQDGSAHVGCGGVVEEKLRVGKELG